MSLRSLSEAVDTDDEDQAVLQLLHSPAKRTPPPVRPLDLPKPKRRVLPAVEPPVVDIYDQAMSLKLGDKQPVLGAKRAYSKVGQLDSPYASKAAPLAVKRAPGRLRKNKDLPLRPPPAKRVKRAAAPVGNLEEELESEEEEEKSLYEYSPQEIKQIERLLEGDDGSKRFSNAVVMFDTTVLTVRRGDFLRVADGTVDGPGWLVEVLDIRGLKSQIKPSLDEQGVVRLSRHGKIIEQAEPLWIRTTWMYRAEDFTALKSSRFPKEVVKALGENERVRVDASTWNMSDVILPQERGELVLHFDDCYPATSDSTGSTLDLALVHTLSHPLSLYSKPPSRRSSSSSPTKSPKETPSTVELPSFFFGDDHGLDNSSDGGRDADEALWERTIWVRTEFQFEDDGVGSSSKGGKRKAPDRVGPALSLNLHSKPLAPYNPAESQHFSPTSSKWYSLKDLFRLKSFAAAPSPTAEKKGSTPLALNSWREELEALRGSAIVRGGSFGLTGNVFLVVSAHRLVASLPPSPPSAGVGEKNKKDKEPMIPTELMGSIEQLLEEAREWQAGVLKRENLLHSVRKVPGKGKGVKKLVAGPALGKGAAEENAWETVTRGMNTREGLPRGMQWVDPATKAVI